jgi:hypothetical protein
MHVEDALPLTDLAEICPCSLQEAMERVGRMVELGVLELIDDEPILPHIPLPALLRSVAPANASQAPAASADITRAASVAPKVMSNRPARETSNLVPAESMRPAAERARSLRPSAPDESTEDASYEDASYEDASYEDAANENDAYGDEPATGLRARFEIDPRAARRALLGAVVLARRSPDAAANATGNQRVRRRARSST